MCITSEINHDGHDDHGTQIVAVVHGVVF